MAPTPQEVVNERERIEQSNDAAGIVIEAAAKACPDLFVTLNLRYGIADALWAAGYRKHPEPEITDEPEWEYRTTVGDTDPHPHGRLNRGEVTEAEVLDLLAEDPRPLVLERRQKAGPWEPVGEGEHEPSHTEGGAL